MHATPSQPTVQRAFALRIALPLWLVAAAFLSACATGMKILPPARKLPVWPLMAITVGSASTLTRASSLWASMVRPRLPEALARLASPAPPLRKSASRL